VLPELLAVHHCLAELPQVACEAGVDDNVTCTLKYGCKFSRQGWKACKP